MFTTALLAVAPNWKPKQSWIVEMDELQCSHMMEYYIAMEKNKVLIYSNYLYEVNRYDAVWESDIVYSCIFTVYMKFKDSKTIQWRKKSEKWLFRDEETGNN